MAQARRWTPGEWLLLLLIVATSPLFFLGGTDWTSAPLYRAVWNLGHLFFFAILLWVVQGVWPVKTWRGVLLLLSLVFLGSGAIELLQARMGREASWLDMANNLLGAGLGLFWRMTARPWVWVARVFISLLWLWPLGSVVRVAWVQLESARQFPQLASFETERELLRWQGTVERVAVHASQGRYALRVTLGQEQYSGVSLERFLGDWSGYDALAFEVWNPDEDNLPLVLRIHDLQHDQGSMAYSDRFNTRLTMEPGWNYVRIPLDQIRTAPAERTMDLQQLRSLRLFTMQSPRVRQFYLDNLRLE